MSQETVLLVEDNDDIRNFINDAVLRPDGYRALIAKDGQVGLECALSAEPDLILLDLHLPRLSGLTLLNRLHQQHHRIPTIVLAAYGSEKSILKAFRLGAKDFLQKPFKVKGEASLDRYTSPTIRAPGQDNQRRCHSVAAHPS